MKQIACITQDEKTLALQQLKTHQLNASLERRQQERK